MPSRYILAVLLLIPSAMSAQIAPGDSSRIALGVLQKAAAAVGGADALQSVSGFDVRLNGQGISTGPGQAYSPTATVSTTLVTRRLLFDLSGGRALREGTTAYPGTVTFHTLTIARDAMLVRADLGLWRTGTDLAVDSTAGREAQAVWARSQSHAVLRGALAANTSTLGYSEEHVADHGRMHVVRYTNTESKRITLHIDAESHLIRSATPGEFPGSAFHYSDYRRVGALLIAHHVVLQHPAVSEDLWVTSIELNPAINDSVFANPSGYTRFASAVQPKLTMLAEGVFRVDGMPGDYHTAVIDLGDKLALLDAPQNAQWSTSVLELLMSKFGAKPVGYVLITHHHSDHVGGLAAYAARGARIVAGRGVTERMKRILPDTIRDRATFQEIDSAFTIGAGKVRILAMPVPNEHADGAVAYYVPHARALLQGDLFYIPERGPVPRAFSVTADLARVIDAYELRVETIVGIHGRSGTYRELQESLAKRSGLWKASTPHRD